LDPLTLFDSAWTWAILGTAIVLFAVDLYSTGGYLWRLQGLGAPLRWMRQNRRDPDAFPDDGALQSWATEHIAASPERRRLDLRGGRYLLVRTPTLLQQSPPRSPVRFAPALLTALGVLGTFWGIAYGLQGLDQATIGDDTGAMLDSIWGLMDGMKTAFNTSLVGLFLAGCAMSALAITESFKRRRWRTLRRQLSEVAFLESPLSLLRQLASEDRREADRAQVQAAHALQQAAGQLQSSLGELQQSLMTFNADAIGQRVGEVLERSIKPVFEGVRSDLQGIQELMVNQNQRLLADLRKEVFEPVTERLDQSAETTRQAAEAVQTLQAELGGAIQTIREFQTHTLGQLNEFADALQTLLTQFREDTKGVMESVATEIKRSVDSSVAGMDAQRAAFETSAQNASDTFRGIRTDLEAALEARAATEREMLDQTRAGVQRILNDAQSTFAQQSQTLTTVGEQSATLMDGARERLEGGLANIDSALQTTCASVEQQLEAFRGSYQERLTAFFTQQNELLEQTLGAQREGLASVVTTLNSTFEQEIERRQALTREMDERFERLGQSTAELQELVEAVGLTKSAQMSQVQEAARNIGAQIKRLALQYRTMDQSFQSALDSGAEALRGYVEASNSHNATFYTQLDQASAKAIEGIAGAAEYLVAAEQQRRLTQPPPSDR